MDNEGKLIHVLLVRDSVYEQERSEEFDALCDQYWDIDKRSAEQHLNSMRSFSQYRGFHIVALNTSSEQITILYERLMGEYLLASDDMKTEHTSFNWRRNNEGIPYLI